MRNFLASPLAPDGLGRLLKYNLLVFLVSFGCLELWRPYFFLTDDNFSALWPVLTEIGRNLKSGQSPFVSHYLFGGYFDLTRDLSSLLWHPVYMLPALLSDTPVRFLIIDLVAFLFLLLAAVGFTLLARALVREFNPALPAGYIVFYTASFVFSSYVFIIGASWVQFLGNLSALPWLLLGILNRRLLLGTLIVLLFTWHEIFSAFAASIVVNALCLTLFSFCLAFVRRSATPFCNFVFGTMLALLIASPFLVRVLEGFAHSSRAGGLLWKDNHQFHFPVVLYPFAFFTGSWTEVAAHIGGFKLIKPHDFPHFSLLLACAASWCVLSAVFNRARWRGIEISCAIMMAVLLLFITRPIWISIAMSHVTFVRSLRHPFREIMQLLFFFHVFLLVRPPLRHAGWQAGTALFSFVMFVLPLPFATPPSFKALNYDRAQLFSGKADLFWARVKTLIKPDDDVATVIPVGVWDREADYVPYLMIGTANFPAYLKIKCVSGYAPTIAMDAVPMKTRLYSWFGAFDDISIPLLLQERPHLRIIEILQARPLRLVLLSDGKTTDLTPLLPK